MNRNKEEDLRKLADAVIENLQYDDMCEYGSIGVDCKRPFGNSDVEADMLEIIGWDMEGDDGDDACYSSKQRDYVRTLYMEELPNYIKKLWKELTKGEKNV